jgi:uncharacterized phage protein (TIGR02220 family)
MYGKIFEEIFDSSLMVKGGPMATYVFMSMIVLADENGLLKLSPQALGRRIGLKDGQGQFIQWQEFYESLKILEADDPESNLPAENGRRLIPLGEITDGEENRGWWIVNYEFYREKASRFDKRLKTKERVQRFRERQKEGCNADVTQGNTKKRNVNGKIGHTDTDTDTDIYKYIVDFLNQKTKKSFRWQTPKTQKSIKARLNEGFSKEDFVKVIEIKSSKWLSDSKMMDYLRPETLFGTKFESYLNESKKAENIEEQNIPRGKEWTAENLRKLHE